jgi:hypothetical protein
MDGCPKKPAAMPVVIADQAGFHLPSDDLRLPANFRLPPLPPYSPELNPVERFGGPAESPVDQSPLPEPAPPPGSGPSRPKSPA